MSKITQIMEGWAHNLTPKQLLNQQVIDVSTERMLICNSCEEHSSNKKDYKIHLLNGICSHFIKNVCFLFRLILFFQKTPFNFN